MSFIFILTCIIWYGGRAIYYYFDTKKALENDRSTLAIKIQKDKNNNLKSIGTDYYFQGNNANNYILYSNILWRIIKITKDNNIVLIAENPITNLAFGKDKTYNDSYPIKWLNNKDEKFTGILENNLKDKKEYLTKTKTCIDNIINTKKITCQKNNTDNYISLLSVIDYINTGDTKSFINNGKYTYLANNNNQKIWYIDTEGNLNKSNGTDIYGIKPVITLNSKVNTLDGNGSKDKPYIITKNNNKFASFVKLDNDIWRIYNEDDNNVKLVLNDYIKKDDEILEYSYSNNNYYHNDTIYDSLAYYLNTTYLNSLKYKDLIIENDYQNSYYGKDNNYDYSDVLNTTIKTKVALLSIGDSIINNELNNYFLLAGPEKETEEIYTVTEDSKLDTIYTVDEAYIVPTITIKKNSLVKGTGSKDDPYRTE